jgi:hypothetical protein
MAFEFVSISGGDGAGQMKERAFIVAKNAYTAKATYGQHAQWYCDIEAAFTTLGNGWDFTVTKGDDATLNNNPGLSIGPVWPNEGIQMYDWGRILVFGEHPAAKIFSAATAPFADFYDDGEKTGAEMEVGVLRPWGAFLATAAREGYLGFIAFQGAQAVDEAGAATYTIDPRAHWPGGYGVPIANSGTGFTGAAGTARIFWKGIG